VLNVIGAKPEVRDNLLVATILSFPTPVYWSRSAFGALGNPSSALDLVGCLLGMAFTTAFVRDPSIVTCHSQTPVLTSHEAVHPCQHPPRMSLQILCGRFWTWSALEAVRS
jgi:hypothetical protein